jgi:prolyl-tRNA editing enzyme YbaK/EbsC (Cys-tRNA(Pro) deacylase)
MALPGFDGLDSLPVREHLDLVAVPVADALRSWPRTGEVAVVEIDPDLADTAALTEAYSLPLEASVNCVLVAGSRGGEERIAACLVAADTRADVNTVVRKLLDVRKASFLPMDRATAESGMEYGGITPVGLPEGYRVLVDSRVTVPDEAGDLVVIGSGLRRSKIALPGALLGRMPGAEVVDGLALANGS